MVGGLIHSPHFQNRADWECDGEEKKIRCSYLLSILQIFGLELDQKDTKDITDVRISFGQLEKCASEEDVSDTSTLSYQNISVDIEEGHI